MTPEGSKSFWAQIEEATEGFGKSPAEIETERKAKLDEIAKEPKLFDYEIRGRALDFAKEAQEIADSTPSYREEHYEAAKRHREDGAFTPVHTYTITLNASRWRIYSSTTIYKSREITLSRRDIDPNVPDYEHRKFEAMNVSNDEIWNQKAIIKTGTPTYSTTSPAALEYEGPDPKGDESLGKIKIKGTQRTSEGVESMIMRFSEDRQYRPPNPNINLDDLNLEL